MDRMRLRTLLALATALWALLAAASAGAAPNYVALGDSFAAGPFISSPLSPFGCLRSGRNYAHLTAAEIGLPLRDVSCSGATTDHMAGPQGAEPGGPNPPQLSALRADTRIVSLTIGGNDIGFSEVLLRCATPIPAGRPCRNRYARDGTDLIGARIRAAAPAIGRVLRGIRARAPRARVFVVNYPAIFPAAGDGCWPQMPFAPDDVPYLRAKQRQLNSAIAAQAAANGARLVDWYEDSLGRDACRSRDARWVEPLAPGNFAAPVHPNAAGMRGAARALVAAIRGH